MGPRAGRGPTSQPHSRRALKGEGGPGYRRLRKGMTTAKPGRQLHKIKVSASTAEREAIVTAAASVGLSTSSYLRQIGLAYRPTSIVDLERVDAMMKLSQETKGLGHLLKWWLADDPRLANFAHVEMPVKIRQALARIDQLHTEIGMIAGTVLKVQD